MSSTITLLIPCAENEQVFLQLVVRAAIRAHRDECYVSSKQATEEYLKDLAEIARCHDGSTNPDGGGPLQ
jgi:hypothetical protein